MSSEKKVSLIHHRYPTGREKTTKRAVWYQTEPVVGCLQGFKTPYGMYRKCVLRSQKTYYGICRRTKGRERAGSKLTQQRLETCSEIFLKYVGDALLIFKAKGNKFAKINLQYLFLQNRIGRSKQPSKTISLLSESTFWLLRRFYFINLYKEKT